jgi:hypothetical protein
MRKWQHRRWLASEHVFTYTFTTSPVYLYFFLMYFYNYFCEEKRPYCALMTSGDVIRLTRAGHEYTRTAVCFNLFAGAAQTEPELQSAATGEKGQKRWRSSPRTRGCSRRWLLRREAGRCGGADGGSEVLRRARFCTNSHGFLPKDID